MKSFIKNRLFVSFLAFQVCGFSLVFAGLPPTTLKGQSGSKVTTFDFQVPHQQATTVSGPTRLIETGNDNLLANPGGEGGTAGWTETGAGALASETTAANVASGAKAISFDASAASETVQTDAVTTPPKLYNRNVLARCYVKTASTDMKMQIYDGATVLAQSNAITAASTYIPVDLNVVGAASQTLQIRFLSASDSAILYVDDCYLGDAINLTNVSQASFIGSAYFATTTNCIYAVTNTSLAAMSDADCPGPTVELNPGPGTIQTTDYDAPKVAVNNLGPGTYEVGFVGPQYVTTSNQRNSMAISDGTTQSGQASFNGDSAAGAGFHLTGFFTYTTSGNRTFEIFASSAANAMNIDLSASNQRLYFYIKRFPTSTELAVKPDQITATFGSISWAGTAACSWSVTANNSYTSYSADTDCPTPTTTGAVTAPGTKIPAAVMNGLPAGTYEVVATGILYPNTASGSCAYRFTDGTNNFGFGATGSAQYNVTSTVTGWVTYSGVGDRTIQIQATGNGGNYACVLDNTSAVDNVTISIKPLSRAIPAPILVNSVVSASSGVEAIHRIRFGGSTDNTNAATDRCTVSPCTIYRQDGNWVTSVTRNSAGIYKLNIAAGTFSQIPVCTCIAIGVTVANTFCNHDVQTNNFSTTAVTFGSKDADNVFQDSYMDVLCMGPK